MLTLTVNLLGGIDLAPYIASCIATMRTRDRTPSQEARSDRESLRIRPQLRRLHGITRYRTTSPTLNYGNSLESMKEELSAGNHALGSCSCTRPARVGSQGLESGVTLRGSTPVQSSSGMPFRQIVIARPHPTLSRSGFWGMIGAKLRRGAVLVWRPQKSTRLTADR